MIKYIDSSSCPYFNDFFSEMNRASLKVVNLDTEGNGLDPHVNRMLLLQIGIRDDIFVFDTAKLGLETLKGVVGLLNAKGVEVVGHNLKYDLKMILGETGILLKNGFDTMTTEALINSGVGSALYSLAELVEKYCSITLDKTVRNEFIDMPYGTAITLNQVMYSATDVLHLSTIYRKQKEAVEEANLGAVHKLEMDLIPVVSYMEFTGIKIDPPVWVELENLAQGRADIHHKEIIEVIVNGIDYGGIENALQLADKLLIPVTTKRDRAALETLVDPTVVKDWAVKNFNTNSNPQMKNALGLLGINVVSTNEKVLNKLPETPVIKAILSYREHAKLASTYGSNIADQVNPVTHRIHTDFINIGTETGRFSSKNPNLQNIPANDEYRRGFVSEPSYSFINMDYSQQELRLAGAISGEPRIIDAYIAGQDLHYLTASLVFHKSIESISKKERGFGKTLNFAIIYGTTEYGLKKNLSISIDEAKSLISNFYAGYPKLAAFKSAAEDKILELGYSITPLGRRRYFEERPLFATPRDIERITARTKREGFNHIIQGCGADVTKTALRNMFYGNPFGDLFRIILQVHDEIGVEAADTILEDAILFMKETMIRAFEPFLKGIPAEVDYKVGKVWSK